MKLTTKQVNKLHELAFASVTNREIAAQMGLPISEVYAQRSRMGITRDKVALAKGEAPRTVMAKHIPLKKAKKPTYTFEDVTPKKEKALKVEALGLTENDLFCAMKHLKAYFEQSCDNEIADWGKPCIDCSRCKTCDFTHIDHTLRQLSSLTGLIISRNI